MPAVPFIYSMAATLVAFLANASVGIVGKILVSLGIGIASAVGMNAVMATVTATAFTDSDVIKALSAVGIDWLISTIFSAITTRATMKGLSSDKVTFWTMRGRIGT